MLWEVLCFEMYSWCLILFARATVMDCEVPIRIKSACIVCHFDFDVLQGRDFL